MKYCLLLSLSILNIKVCVVCVQDDSDSEDEGWYSLSRTDVRKLQEVRGRQDVNIILTNPDIDILHLCAEDEEEDEEEEDMDGEDERKQESSPERTSYRCVAGCCRAASADTLHCGTSSLASRELLSGRKLETTPNKLSWPVQLDRVLSLIVSPSLSNTEHNIRSLITARGHSIACPISWPMSACFALAGT